MWESISGCPLQLQLHSLSHCSLPFPPCAINETSVVPPFFFMCHHPQLCFCLACLSHSFSLHLSAASGCCSPVPSLSGMLLEYGLTLPCPKSLKSNGQRESVHSKGHAQAHNASVDGTAPHFCKGTQVILQVC